MDYIEKRLFGLLGMAGALLLTLGSSPPAGDPFLRTLTLEQARSLGDGELARYLASPDERLAARAALAHVAQAMNGQGLDYELYSKDWLD